MGLVPSSSVSEAPDSNAYQFAGAGQKRSTRRFAERFTIDGPAHTIRSEHNPALGIVPECALDRQIPMAARDESPSSSPAGTIVTVQDHTSLCYIRILGADQVLRGE